MWANVYVFGEPGMLLVKVGKSLTPRERERDLKRDWQMPNGRMLYMHTEASGLAEQAALRILRTRYWLQGEWFVCGLPVARAVIRHARRKLERQYRENRYRDRQRKLRRQAKLKRSA